MREAWRYLVLSWRWFAAYLSWRRMVRDVALLPYLGAPIWFHPRTGLYVKPARTVSEWRRNMRIARLNEGR